MTPPRRIVIAAGGTGGHFYPGYVLGRALRDRGWEVLYLVRSGDPAAATLARESLPFVEVDLRGLPRERPLEWPRFAWRLAGSLRLTRNVLRDFRPACVAGMGGYLTFPAAACAWWLDVPTLIHESNAVLGLANRAAAPIADRIALGLPSPGAPEPGRALTGTPVRPALWKLPSRAEARHGLGLDPDARTVLVFGGSQGARVLNHVAPQAARLLAAGGDGAQWLHLSGEAEAPRVRADYEAAGAFAQVRGYLEGMELAYAAADLVLSRAGASTLAELIAVRRPAILIPFPSAAAGHQDANARVLESAGAALRLPEPVSPEDLASALRESLAADRLRALADGYGAIPVPSPAESLAALVREVEALAG